MNLLKLIKDTLEDKKARDITVIDFKNTSPVCDFFVICDAQSTRQMNAIFQDVEKTVVEAGFEVNHQKNTPDSKWLIIDAVDVVVHIFQSDERAHYDLEKLYKEFVRD